MKRVVLSCALVTLVCGLPLAAAAQNGTLTRTFVSSAGVDGSTPCTIAQPCATFARAYTQTAPNGIIAALDPGKYGPLNITGPVTVNGNGWAAITGTGNTAISINAVSGNVTLSGLEIDGAKAGNIGIQFFSGDSLEISDTQIRNFTGPGISFAPSGTSQLYVSNTLVARNSGTGIIMFPEGSGAGVTTQGLLDHVKAEGNGVDGFSVLNPSDVTQLTITDSVSVGNTGNGITALANGVKMQVIVRNSTINNNTGSGLSALNGAGIIVTRSMVSANHIAYTTNNSNNYATDGEVVTYGDNNFEHNSVLSGAPPTVSYK
jgi:hypothetical protein